MKCLFVFFALALGFSTVFSEESEVFIVGTQDPVKFWSGPSFTFFLMKNDNVEFEKVEFTLEQYSVLTKALSKANPDARANFVPKGGFGISSSHPLVELAMKNGLKRGFIMGAQF